MEYQAILFDLDGTLVDSLADLANSMNAALAKFGFPTHPVDAYRFFIGNGMRSLVRRTLPKDHLDDDTIAECFAAAVAEYANRWDETTKPYPGISELLDNLQERDIPMAILSNKPDEFTQLTVKKILSKWNFAIVRGVSSTVVKKPDPAAAIKIAEELGIPPRNFLYLGDTNTDMQTANSAGMFAAGVLWGFRPAKELKESGAKVLIAEPRDLLKLLSRQQ